MESLENLKKLRELNTAQTKREVLIVEGEEQHSEKLSPKSQGWIKT